MARLKKALWEWIQGTKIIDLKSHLPLDPLVMQLRFKRRPKSLQREDVVYGGSLSRLMAGRQDGAAVPHRQLVHTLAAAVVLLSVPLCPRLPGHARHNGCHRDQ